MFQFSGTTNWYDGPVLTSEVMSDFVAILANWCWFHINNDYGSNGVGRLVDFIVHYVFLIPLYVRFLDVM